MLDRIWLQVITDDVIKKVKENNAQPERYVSELYNTMMYINQLFGQEMEQWLLEHHYRLEGQK